MSLAGSARYLISPLVAGLLLSISDVKLLLIIDISTFVLTVISTAVVKKGIETKSGSEDKSFMESLKEGWDVVHSKQGIFLLILVSAVMTLFLGVFQILAEPLILSFADSKTLGIGETVCACGMLVSSLILGVRGIKKRYVKVLEISLMCAGLFMIGFGIWSWRIVGGFSGKAAWHKYRKRGRHGDYDFRCMFIRGSSNDGENQKYSRFGNGESIELTEKGRILLIFSFA
ncbi:MAG: hypothetical protein PUC49_01320 [Clostridiales bacterium]|nr:hypothetical protein [Clostridiales bacterium]